MDPNRHDFMETIVVRASRRAWVLERRSGPLLPVISPSQPKAGHLLICPHPTQVRRYARSFQRPTTLLTLVGPVWVVDAAAAVACAVG
jgi:hypothetical protein